MNNVKFVNLTPHTINVESGDLVLALEPSGTIARVTSTSEVVGEVGGIPISRNTFGDVEDMPDAVEGTFLVVSGMVLSALGGTRNDVLAPDSGTSAIRNEKGHIVAVRGFLR